MPFIALRGVSKVYDQLKQPVVALQETDLEIRQREFVSIMGPSGSGKSTLLHILGALDRPSTGTYLLEGVDITALKDKELARVRRDHFGFVFQSYNLFPELTAVENVEVPMIYAGVPARQRRARAKELLERLGLGHRLAHRPLELSGGEQQRVAIARALANGPTMLLADEPTGNLPTEQGRQIMASLAELNEQGMTVVVVTHDPAVAAWGRRLLTLRDGEIVGDEPVSEAPVLRAYLQVAEGAGA
ncbi:MAG: ABC transporter ATP-binding protein [Firmicutes bacterium]|nr:ABC transporter ATP-binding protein [Bacillota bacterium]